MAKVLLYIITVQMYVCGVRGMSFHLFNLNIEKSEVYGVYAWGTKRNTMSNCQVSYSKDSGVFVGRVGLITMNGSGTSIHNNVTGGRSSKYGLHTAGADQYHSLMHSYVRDAQIITSSSSIHLVSPLTKESVSINNGGGGNYGGDGTIKTV